MYRVRILSGADNDVTADNSDLLSLVKNNRAGLKTLRDDHLDILSEIRNEEENRRNTGDNDNAGTERDLEERISAVTESLQMLEVGVAESGVMLSLAAHFDMLESERSITRMEMRRVKVGLSCLEEDEDNVLVVKDENDWLREELEDTEKRLEDALSRLAGLEEEKKHWEFLEQVDSGDSQDISQCVNCRQDKPRRRQTSRKSLPPRSQSGASGWRRRRRSTEL